MHLKRPLPPKTHLRIRKETLLLRRGFLLSTSSFSFCSSLLAVPPLWYFSFVVGEARKRERERLKRALRKVQKVEEAVLGRNGFSPVLWEEMDK